MMVLYDVGIQGTISIYEYEYLNFLGQRFLIDHDFHVCFLLRRLIMFVSLHLLQTKRQWSKVTSSEVLVKEV